MPCSQPANFHLIVGAMFPKNLSPPSLRQHEAGGSMVNGITKNSKNSVEPGGQHGTLGCQPAIQPAHTGLFLLKRRDGKERRERGSTEPVQKEHQLASHFQGRTDTSRTSTLWISHKLRHHEDRGVRSVIPNALDTNPLLCGTLVPRGPPCMRGEFSHARDVGGNLPADGGTSHAYGGKLPVDGGILHGYGGKCSEVGGNLPAASAGGAIKGVNVSGEALESGRGGQCCLGKAEGSL